MKFKALLMASVISASMIAAVPAQADGLTGILDELSELADDIEAAGEEAAAALADNPATFVGDTTSVEDEAAAAVSEIAEAADEAAAEVQTAAADAAPGEGIFADTDIFGGWYGVKTEGNSRYTLTGEFMLMPDHSIAGLGDEIQLYFNDTDTEGVYTVDVPEELAEDVREIRLSVETMEIPVDTTSPMMDFLDNSVGASCLRVIITAASTDNPLAGDEETVSTFLRYKRQDDFLEALMIGKVWKIGENSLAIDSERNLSLNGGKSTGYCSFSGDDEHSTTVWFSWDGGKGYTYELTSVTETSVTLQNVDNPDEVLLLEYDGDLEEVAVEIPAVESTAAGE